MNHKTRFTALCCALLLCLSLPVAAQSSIQQQKDSLRQAITKTEGKDRLKTYTRLYCIYMNEIADSLKRDTLMRIFDETEAEAIKQGDVLMQGMLYGNTIITLVNCCEYDKVIEKAPSCIDFLYRHKLWKFYYQIHMQLITVYNMKGDYESASKEAEIMYERAKAQNHKGGMATALYGSSFIYSHQERWKDQEFCLRECIGLLWDISGYANIQTQAYALLCSSLRAQGQCDEVLKLIPRYKKAIERFEKDAGRSQPEAWLNFYSALMNTYIEIGEYDKAGIYLSRLEKLSYNKTTDFEMLLAKARINLANGNYNESLAAIDSATINASSSFNLNEVRKLKFMLLARTGRYNEAFEVINDILATNDTIKNVEINNRFDELRTQYEVEKYITEKERNFHYFLFALGICLFLILLLAGAFYYNRIIAGKNRNLYEHIKEQDRLADELFRITHANDATHSSKKAAEVQPTADEFMYSDDQYDLVARLREYLLCNENLSNADTNREDITSALGTNKNTLSEAVKAVTGKSPMEYMRTLKIDEARKMIDHHPEYTVEAVAYSCGFSIPSTFYRMFKKQYGISPAEYRKMVKLQN